MMINFSRNPYSNGVQRNFQLQNGPFRLEGGNDRRIDENGYHHSNQVAFQSLGSQWSTILGASTERTVQPKPLEGLNWTQQWMA